MEMKISMILCDFPNHSMKEVSSIRM